MLKLLLDYELFTAIHGFHEFGIDMTFADVQKISVFEKTIKFVVNISEVMLLVQN